MQQAATSLVATMILIYRYMYIYIKCTHTPCTSHRLYRGSHSTTTHSHTIEFTAVEQVKPSKRTHVTLDSLSPRLDSLLSVCLLSVCLSVSLSVFFDS